MRALLFGLFLLPTAAVAAPPSVQPGQQYPGPATVRFDAVGVDLKIPAKWIGAMAPNGEAFLLVSKTEPGMIVATGEPESSVAKVKASMSEAFPLEDVTLTPVGRPKVKGNRVTQSYSGSGGKQPLIGEAAAIVKGGVAVGFVAVGPKSAQRAHQRLVARLVKSVRFLPKPKAGDTGGGAWHQKLAGYALEHLRTSGGLSTRHTIHLCRNGTFSSSGGDSYLSGGFSAVGSSGSSGTWRIAGSTLTLTHRGGGTTKHAITAKGSKTFLDGTRYFVANPASCR
ncbi:MAG: hypothetical protein RIT81_22170 [Deltaproteobacteria bacterium]